MLLVVGNVLSVKRERPTIMTKRLLPSLLGNFLAFWRPSLGRRLTISFTIFGLVIGYFVFIFLAISGTNAFIRLASDTARTYISSISDGGKSDKGDELLRLLERRGTDIANSALVLHGIFPQLKFDLYFQDKGQWQQMYLDDQGVIQSHRIDNAALATELKNVRNERIMSSFPFFYGAQDKVNVKINITGKDDRHRYILAFDIHRQGIIAVIQKNFYKSIIFFLVLLTISHTLGHLFSIRLARPIEQLAHEAMTIATGQYKHRFTTGRKDEIGMLAEALNNMASRIIDGTRERENILIGILIALTRTIDAKSPWTAGHSERVTRFAEAIGRGLRLNDDQMRVLSISAILHDIGKIAVPEQILDKPAKLTDEEFDIVRKHPRAGADIISSIPSYDPILAGIIHHHERWDGTGYPDGLKGENIPLFARIICLADVYDALTADRPYRSAWSSNQTIQFLEAQKAKMFDPTLVDVFKAIVNDIDGRSA